MEESSGIASGEYALELQLEKIEKVGIGFHAFVHNPDEHFVATGSTGMERPELYCEGISGYQRRVHSWWTR